MLVTAARPGDKLYVVCSWQTEAIPAEILERRLKDSKQGNNTQKKKNSGEGAGSSTGNRSVDDEDSLSADKFEYYVHFIGFDRRLDEWVEPGRIHFGSVVDDELLRSEDKGLARPRKIRRRSETADDVEEKEKRLADLEKRNASITKVKNITQIQLGGFAIKTWYFSPFPEGYHGVQLLRVCNCCLKYMRSRESYKNHVDNCPFRAPPGRKIYDEGDLTMYEVVGKDHKIYCQNLCLLSKLFLDHKTLYYDVDPFLFYVLCEKVEETEGWPAHDQVVGYFSKEKQSQENYNLACILTFPPWQKKGYGKFLISVSYELSKREGKTGSPEKPLSDLGQISYRSYWSYVLLQLINDWNQNHRTFGIYEMCNATGIGLDDVVYTMHQNQLLRHWKGQYIIMVNEHLKDKVEDAKKNKRMRLCKPKYLTWEPPTTSEVSR